MNSSKRPLSPSSSLSHEQETKRSRAVHASPAPVKSCLHCRSMLHIWVECANVCLTCHSVHYRKRCPALDIAKYVPAGGFKVPKSAMSIDQLCGNAEAEDVEPHDEVDVVSYTDFTHDVDPFQGQSLHDGPTHRFVNEDEAAVSTTIQAQTQDNLQLQSGKTGLERSHSNGLHGAQSVDGQSFSDSVTSGAMNSARAAMIACTPVFEPQREVDALPEPKPTGENMLPLGTRKPSRSAVPAPVSYSIPSTGIHKLGPQVPSRRSARRLASRQRAAAKTLPTANTFPAFGAVPALSTFPATSTVPTASAFPASSNVPAASAFPALNAFPAATSTGSKQKNDQHKWETLQSQVWDAVKRTKNRPFDQKSGDKVRQALNILKPFVFSRGGKGK